MFHTQSRHDRDQYLLLDTKNIKPQYLYQFTKHTTTTNDNYGIPYDYGSIMHYGTKSFSINGRRTMIPVDKNYADTMRSPFVSFYDLLMMNTHYKCLEKCKSTPSVAKCTMGGFPNPRDCSKCVCPGGYGGRLCNERPPGCGMVLKATPSSQPLIDIVGHRAVTWSFEKDDFKKCHYWIQAPQRRRITIRIVNFTDRLATEGCYFAGFEIKTQRDQRRTGYRFCSPSHRGKVFESETNIVPIITYSRVWPVKTELEYRIVESLSSSYSAYTSTKPPGWELPGNIESWIFSWLPDWFRDLFP